MVGLGRATTRVATLVIVTASPDWMAEHFEILQHRTLLEITLPGSHNSGNYQGGLHADLLCESDYKYGEYLGSASSHLLQESGRPLLSQAEFDRRMIPWNINHFRPINAQLSEGVRFLHLKICNFGAPGAPTMDLGTVHFQHRGYTTRETVASTLQELRAFLDAHPKEIVILGFNNLHNRASKSFGEMDIAALAVALETSIGPENLISREQLYRQTLRELVEANRRIAVFLKVTRTNPSMALAPAFVSAGGPIQRPAVERPSVAVSTPELASSPGSQASKALAAGSLALVLGSRAKPRQSRKGLRVVPTRTVRNAAPPGVYCESAEKCIRRKTRTVYVGEVPRFPMSRTTTLTSDVDGTVEQIMKCAEMGIDIVRVTVQGMTEAKACEHIKKKLLEKGCKTPIVADIHFTPKVALVCADFVDKVRVNPGNFADGRKSFDTISELTEEDNWNDVKEAQEAIEEALTPLVLKLKEQGKAMRIGVNHGSLAERILFQYGDSPEGMVASAIEFGEICRKHDYHDFIFSMKSSNPQVMVNAYRQLAREMYKLGWDRSSRASGPWAFGVRLQRFPLLLTFPSDTIRVSLTEDPEFEAKPCIALRGAAEEALSKGVEPFDEHTKRREGVFYRRECSWPIDVKELADLDIQKLCDRLGLRLRADGDVQMEWKSVDAVVLDGMVTPNVGVKLKTLLDVPTGVICKAGPNVPEGATVMVTAAEAAKGDKMSTT
eukprot:g22614.t1